MFPPFPEEKAFDICNQIITSLENGSVKLEQLGKVSDSRGDHGIMIGAALCKDADGRLLILKTVSGISKKLVLASDDESIYVEPIVSAEEIETALKQNDKEIHQLTDEINRLKAARKLENGKYSNITEEERKLVERRKFLCNQSLKNVYELYSFHTALNTVVSLGEICADLLPPTGTGDCCAPKLLDYAFSNRYSVVSMAEVFYGKDTAYRQNGRNYPPCDERCGLILPEMLGLNILYRDEEIIVVNKQSGLLSVPGRGPDKQDCIVNRVRLLFPECIEQPSVHRLDMETSGLLVLAFTKASHRNLQQQFEKKIVQKKYVALIDGILQEESGEMTLYFRLDVENRPHQIWDIENGKEAVTQWKKIGFEKYTAPDGKKRTVTRVEFTPLTGRTHQLRLASADSHGFGKPIIGDTLYGRCEKGERLMLHAQYLSFIHPVTGRQMEFFCPADF